MYVYTVGSGACVATDNGYVPVEYLSVKDRLLTRSGTYPIVGLHPEYGSFKTWTYTFFHCQSPIHFFGDNYVLGDDGSELLLRATGEPIIKKFSLLRNKYLRVKYFPALSRMYFFITRYGYTASRLVRFRKSKIAHQLVLRSQYLLRGFPEQMPRGLLGCPDRTIKKLSVFFREKLQRHKCDFCSLADALHIQEFLTHAKIPHTIRVVPSRIYATSNVSFFSEESTGLYSDIVYDLAMTRYHIETASPELVVNGVIILG